MTGSVDFTVVLVVATWYFSLRNDKYGDHSTVSSRRNTNRLIDNARAHVEFFRVMIHFRFAAIVALCATLGCAQQSFDFTNVQLPDRSRIDHGDRVSLRL